MSARVDIFEKQEDGGRRLAVRHFFPTPRDEQSHRKSDRFLNAALSGRKFKGMALVVKRKTAPKPKRKLRRGSYIRKA